MRSAEANIGSSATSRERPPSYAKTNLDQFRELFSSAPRGGVIGVKREQALESFLTQMPVRFETAEDDVWVMGAVVEIGPNGLAEGIEQVLVPAQG